MLPEGAIHLLARIYWNLNCDYLCTDSIDKDMGNITRIDKSIVFRMKPVSYSVTINNIEKHKRNSFYFLRTRLYLHIKQYLYYA